MLLAFVYPFSGWDDDDDVFLSQFHIIILGERIGRSTRHRSRSANRNSKSGTSNLGWLKPQASISTQTANSCTEVPAHGGSAQTKGPQLRSRKSKIGSNKENKIRTSSQEAATHR